MATHNGEKHVWVAVYVEQPKQRALLSSSHQQQHHHRHHYHHQAKDACRSPGYDRKANLLEYSRQLRESVQSQTSSPLLPVSHHQNQQFQSPSPLLRVSHLQNRQSRSPSPLMQASSHQNQPPQLPSPLLQVSHQQNQQSQSTSPLMSVSHHQSPQQPRAKMVSVQKKRRHSTPSCMGKWKFLVPGFIRSMLKSSHKKHRKTKRRPNNRSTTTKLKSMMKSFQVKKGAFSSKMFTSARKHPRKIHERWKL